MFTFIIFILVLGLLVFVHECGHFLVARKLGVKVYEFGFGLPPRIFGLQVFKEPAKRWRLVLGADAALGGKTDNSAPTIYSLNWIPLGGFVRIKGEDGGSGADAGDSDSFVIRPPWHKTAILSAGVLMNVFLAFVLLSLGYMVGLPQANDSAGARLPDGKIQILQVMPERPAAAVGLKPGDAILKLDQIERPRVEEFQNYLDANKNKAVVLIIQRGQDIFTQSITPAVSAETGKGIIGVAIAEVGLVKYPWYQAIYYGLLSTLGYLQAIFLAFFFLIKGLFTGAGAGVALSGPVGVAVMTGQVAKMGISYLIQFTAMLSLNLAVLNILPIPALDGGRIVFVWFNKLFRRSTATKFEQAAHTVGYGLLMLLLLAVTVKDLGMFKQTFLDFFSRIF